MFDEKRIEQLNWAFGMDGGGYSWENPENIVALQDLACVIWDDPDFDYLGIQDAIPKGSGWLGSGFVAFAPNSGHFARTEWPKEVHAYAEGWPDSIIYKLLADGDVYQQDVDCDCRGKWLEWTGAAGEPTEPERIKKSGKKLFWFFTGNSQDRSWPRCPKCEGNGSIEVPGGEWAYYVPTFP